LDKSLSPTSSPTWSSLWRAETEHEILKYQYDVRGVGVIKGSEAV
jgi:hypothetical protein